MKKNNKNDQWKRQERKTTANIWERNCSNSLKY